MNRTEQKKRLKDILSLIADAKKDLTVGAKAVKFAIEKIDEFNSFISEFNQVESWDEEQLKREIIDGLLDDYLSSIHSELEEFKSDLEEYMSELSESRQEKLEEAYYDLEEVVEKFDFESQEYDSIENALEHIEEAEEMIKQMI